MLAVPVLWLSQNVTLSPLPAANVDPGTVQVNTLAAAPVPVIAPEAPNVHAARFVTELPLAAPVSVLFATVFVLASVSTFPDVLGNVIVVPSVPDKVSEFVTVKPFRLEILRDAN